MSSDFGTIRAAMTATPVTPEVPSAFARDGDPYSLADLLSGLEAVEVEEAPPAEAEPESAAVEDKAGAAALEALPRQAPPPVAPATPDFSAPLRADPDELSARVNALIAAFVPMGEVPMHKGDPTLPDQLDALVHLLSDPPPEQDFSALDALYACWPRSTQESDSRALLAAAHNLGRMFGLPGKLPMATTRAWRMLSPKLFEAELAQRLRDIDDFIADWQATQRVFLILEYSEIELIEYLFESLHPGYHADLLAKVMNFKVLSHRRLGLLRRIPGRLKKQVTPLLPAATEQALVELAHGKKLLETISENGFAPIASAAEKALEEVDKMMKAAANAGAPQLPPGPPGGGMPLGRIG